MKRQRPLPSTPDHPTLPELVSLVQSRRQERHLLLGLDYDGTLVEIAPRPNLARPTPELLHLMARLVARPDYAIVVASGRSLKEIQQLLPLPGLHYLGSHGAEALIAGKSRPLSLPGLQNLDFGALKRQISARLAALPGWWIETKPLGLALHYRQAGPDEEAGIKNALNPWLASLSLQGLYQILFGRKEFEFIPCGVNKGKAFTELLLTSRFNGFYPLYCGDDVTDESVFQLLQGQGLTIKVGTTGKGTQADYFLAHPGEVRQFLALLATQGEEKT